uniref:Reverse transcriptase domain-containing protein n=1 Tax=Tanacetum cinerariifolium TaxID=118510 RepID=A0A6L2KV33_TANCI|nr:hypothetical protein [Tanacetum cinerariifolium]
MNRSSNKEIVTPSEEPERVLRSARKLFKTTSLDYSSLSEFDLFFNLEDQFEEEVIEAMWEPTMEECMTKTREDYGSGIARPKIDEKDRFEFKGQILKELRYNTFSGSNNEDANEHIEKGAIPSMKAADAKKAIHDMADHFLKWHNGTSPRTRKKEVLGELIDRKESATNLKRLLREMPRMGYQIKALINVHDLAIVKDPLPPKEKDPRSFNIPCLGELAPTKSIIELADRTIKRPKDMPEDIKVPLILERPFLSTAHAKIDVFKKKIYLRVGDDNIVFKSDNPTSNIIKRVYMLGLRERTELDLEARLMGEALILNRSLDPKFYNLIMKDKVEYRGKNVVGAFINVPIFVGNFSIVTDFAVVENIDAYRDQDMGEVIVGEPFYREICVKARRFDGIITIYNGVLQIGTRAMVIKNKVETLTITTFLFLAKKVIRATTSPEQMMSSPNHPTSNIEDVFSSNFPNYIPASSDYVPTSSGKTYSSYSNNSFGLVLIASPTLSRFHDDPYMKDMHAYYAKETPIPPQIIMPPSPMLSPMFNPQECFLFKELLPPKKHGRDRSSSSTPTLPQEFKIGESFRKTSLERHEEQIKEILNHLDELSLDRIENMEDNIKGLGKGSGDHTTRF